jgi:hypothetical protein
VVSVLDTKNQPPLSSQVGRMPSRQLAPKAEVATLPLHEHRFAASFLASILFETLCLRLDFVLKGEGAYR